MVVDVSGFIDFRSTLMSIDAREYANPRNLQTCKRKVCTTSTAHGCPSTGSHDATVQKLVSLGSTIFVELTTLLTMMMITAMFDSAITAREVQSDR